MAESGIENNKQRIVSSIKHKIDIEEVIDTVKLLKFRYSATGGMRSLLFFFP